MTIQKPSLRLVQDSPSFQDEHRRYSGELWTSQQRQMHSLHYVVSYRASFKPELPDFCIRRYSKKGDVVLDPFTGRGTTALQANLLGRVAWASDINPLAVRMTKAKVDPARLDEIVLALNYVDFKRPVDLTGFQTNFAPFYHPDTYRELVNLKNFIQGRPDRVNSFIELLAVSRLHGHSPGFFSVYSFPQISIPPERQDLINKKRRQVPEYRAVAPRIIKKAAQALRDGVSSEFNAISANNRIEGSDSRNLHWVSSNSVDLIVTSPPFLDKVDYITDNWLECWFCGVNPKHFQHKLVMCRSIEEWRQFMRDVLREMVRVLKPNCYAVVEVGEVEMASGEIIYLDEIVAQEAKQISSVGKKLVVDEVLINQQNFTKLSNCFNVENNKKGTNTNRMVVLKCVSTKRSRVAR